MRFVDQATIIATAGTGGAGSRHFRRERHVPFGGPDGGDGGRGGDVIIEASARARSLIDYHHRRVHAAPDGKPGGSARKTGRSAEALVLVVPPGTVLFDDETGEQLADLIADGDRHVVAAGGNGGWGNARFKSSRQQAPDRANPGLPGESRTVRMELKLLADVALVGFPNAGKSTLIRTVSASKATVGDYEFTTITPNLGVVQHGGRTFTVADVPGLIEGAADGAGLGHRFLRHIDRCRVLVYLLDCGNTVGTEDQWHILRNELRRYQPELLQRPSVVVLSRSDAVGDELEELMTTTTRALARKIGPLCAPSGVGVKEALDRIVAELPSRAPVDDDAWDPLA